MSDRPTDHLQPSTKRRPGGQLTKSNFDEEEDEGPGYEPGQWGPDSKADSSVLAKRKIVRAARRGPAAVAPSPAQAAVPPDAVAPSDEVAPANPFAGRSLTAGAAAKPVQLANPFAGVSLVAAAKDQGAANEGVEGSEQPGAPAPAAAAALAAAVAAAAGGGGDAAATSATPESAAIEQATAAGEEGSVPEPEGGPGAAPAKPTEDVKPFGTSPTGTASVFGSGGSGFGGFAGGGFGSFAGSTGGFGSFGGSSTAGGGSLFSFAGGAGSSKAWFGGGGQDKGGADGGEGNEDGDGKDGGEGEEVFGVQETAPVVTLEEVPKVTGEEKEEVLFTADGALFEFDAVAKTWHERGRGEFRVNVDPSTRAGRAIMREKASKRLILNARLYATMPTSRMAPPQKGVTFAVVNVAPSHQPADTAPAAGSAADDSSAEKRAAADSSVSQAAMQTYALRLKTVDAVDLLLGVLDTWKAQARLMGGSAGNAATGEDVV